MTALAPVPPDPANEDDDAELARAVLHLRHKIAGLDAALDVAIDTQGRTAAKLEAAAKSVNAVLCLAAGGFLAAIAGLVLLLAYWPR